MPIHKLEVKNTEFDLDCSYESETTKLATTSKDFTDFIYAIYALRDAVGMDEYKVERTAENPSFYEFKIKLEDGRKWEQNMKIDNSSNPLVNFNVADFWRSSEYAPIINARLAVLFLANTYQIKKITIKWL